MTASRAALFAERIAAYNAKFPSKSHDELRSAEKQQFDLETASINQSIVAAENESPSTPTFYLKASSPVAHGVLEKINAVATTMELDLRASQIEEFDDAAHKQVLEILCGSGSRQTITLQQYMIASKEFRDWRSARLEQGLPSHSDAPEGVPQHKKLPAETPLNEVRFIASARPELNMEMFITCPRDPNGGVSVKELFQKFSKQVARLKCEAELIMFDQDGDGRLNEEEVDAYVRYLLPSITSVGKHITPDSIPFYCCAVLRRLFWQLDPTSRGNIRTADLVTSNVMDEWLEVQLERDDPPRNWFSLSVTSQLYEKFLLLDSNETGMLTVTNMKRYKKGIPMVLDDGLPRDVSPLSSLFIERVFETSALYKSEMDYKSFVDFVIAVEFLPQCHRPQFFWTIFDFNGSGVITPITVMHFFRETYQKLVDAGVDAPPLELILQEMFDIIPTKKPLLITREEFLVAPSAGLFSALVIDCLAFWKYENRDHK